MQISPAWVPLLEELLRHVEIRRIKMGTVRRVAQITVKGLEDKGWVIVPKFAVDWEKVPDGIEFELDVSNRALRSYEARSDRK